MALDSNRIPLDHLAEALQEAWARLDTGTRAVGMPILWRPAYTPLLPLAWPVTAETTWLHYGYAYGQDLALIDGVRVARPWARVERRPGDDSVSLVTLSQVVEPFSLQGIRPLDAATLKVLAAGEKVTRQVLAAAGEPPAAEAAELRAYYRAWLADHGAIMTLVAPAHADFLGWING